MKHIRPADGAEPEIVSRSLVSSANIFGRGSEHLIRECKTGESCKNAAGTTLAGEAVANTNAIRFTLNFNTQLTAGT
jgi:hypothetical protein